MSSSEHLSYASNVWPRPYDEPITPRSEARPLWKEPLLEWDCQAIRDQGFSRVDGPGSRVFKRVQGTLVIYIEVTKSIRVTACYLDSDISDTWSMDGEFAHRLMRGASNSDLIAGDDGFTHPFTHTTEKEEHTDDE